MQHRSTLAAMLFAATTAGCTQATTPSSAELASLQPSPVRDQAYRDELGSAVLRDGRDGEWATRTESMLRSSYDEANEPPGAALRTVTCGRLRCALRFELAATAAPKEIIDGQVAVDRWVSTAQSCAYVITQPFAMPAHPRRVDAFTDCSKTGG